jgi:wobble nucleotide-excising tRNase
MIKSIIIKNVATFDNTGIQIDNLKKVNFIYGANASGKTTISNYLNNPDDEKYTGKNCSVKWENDIKLQSLVYNKDFREKNFNGKIAGVFTLGEATSEQIKAIEDKQQQLQSIKDNGLQKKNTIESLTKEKDDLERKFTENCWEKIYIKYKNIFKEAFTGALSKERFKNRLFQEFSDNITSLLSYDELTEKAKTIFGEQPVVITTISSIYYDRITEIETNPIWKKIIIGKADVDIAKLIDKLNINDWVNQGRLYIQESDICPFCQQQTITRDFREQLESFFNETYINDLKLLKELKSEYNILVQNIIDELNTIESNQKDFGNTKLDIDKFAAHLKTLTSQWATNREYLNSKEKEPSRSFDLISLEEQLEPISRLITYANREIQKHNTIVANFQTEKSKLTKSIWKFIIEEFRTNITDFNARKTGLVRGLESLNAQRVELLAKYQTLDNEIKELNKNVTSVQPTIDAINRLLKSFGFLNFEIVTSDENGFYQIKREDGTIAGETLSEGEITFITFLYFLHLAKGGTSENNVNDERILVIDDPISSLDSNVLFIVSSLLKEIIKEIKTDKGNVKQLILLTHNIYFHKEVSFIDGRTKKCSNTNYWILRKNEKISTIQPFLMDNPICSSYELLWQELKNDNVKSCMTIQNIMRRIIEYYFKLLGKYGDETLIQKFTIKEEQEICRSLICWINDGSHDIYDDLCIELQDRMIDIYKKVFKEIFNQTNNLGHYNMMMQEIEEITE